MSKGFWRTTKRTEPFKPGKCATQRVREYIRTWQNRCYSDGIPDEVPAKVAASGRAPSWKAIAVALLQNDLNLYTLGFSTPSWSKQQSTIAKATLLAQGELPNNYQLELFP